MLQCKQSQIKQFFIIQGQITPDVTGGFNPIKLIQGIIVIYIVTMFGTNWSTGRLAQLVERRTCEHNVSGLYRCGFESPAGQLKLLIVFRMSR